MFALLAPEVQARARKAYRLWPDDPAHPYLHYKKVGRVWSARIDQNYRALAKIVDHRDYWFWIGAHSEYERVISQHRKN